MRMDKKGFLGFAVVLALALAAAFTAPWAAADPPGRVSFQGMATDAAGTVLEGPVAMVFRLYDDPSAGTLLWEEAYDGASNPPAVPVSSGLFTVALGDTGHRTDGSETSFQDVFANHGSVYLGVRVGEDPEMTPRIFVAASPFAMNSETLGGKGAEAFAEIGHAHAASDITAGMLPTERGGTGIGGPGAAGYLLTSNGSDWVSAPPPTAASTGAVVDAADTTLTRSGSGTAVSPYKLALNLHGANGWTGAQTFQTNTYFPGPGIWNASGYVGIGAAAPAQGLDMSLPFAAARLTTTGHASGAVLELKNTSTNPAPTLLGAINFNSANNNYPGQIAYQNDHAITFRNSWTERMRIDPEGRVGIGTTNPTADLEVEKPNLDVTFRATDSAPALTFLGGGSGDVGVIRFGPFYMPYGGIVCDQTETLKFQAGAAYRMFLTLWGLGIGVEAPAERLDVYGNANFGDTSTSNKINMKSKEAIWFNGDYFSWGYGGTANRFYDPVGIGGIDPAYKLQISTDSAAKPGTNTWTVASDMRLKKDVTAFTDGLAVLEKIRPIRYRYNGLAGLPADMPCIGVSAQEMLEVAPYTVATFRAKLTEQDAFETELYDFNSHALTFLLINAVKELDAKISALPEGAASGVKRDGGVGETPAVSLQDGAAPVHRVHEAPAETPPHQAAWAPERFPVCEAVEAGDVLVNDPTNLSAFCLGRSAADVGVVGIASENSTGEVSARAEGTGYPQVAVATSGIVRCKVDATYGPIGPNDLLAASPTPGHAMRAPSGAPGTVIGKALEPLDAGTGLIRVVVMLR